MLHKYQQHQCNKVSISKKRCYISMLHGNSKHQSNEVSTSQKQHKVSNKPKEIIQVSGSLLEG